MRSADIEIGGEYAYVDYSKLSKVRVISKGHATSNFNNRRDGIEFEVIAGAPRNSSVAASRYIHPWTSQHDDRLAREAAGVAKEERVARVAERLGIGAISMYGQWVRLYEADFYELAERLGVQVD